MCYGDGDDGDGNDDDGDDDGDDDDDDEKGSERFRMNTEGFDRQCKSLARPGKI